VRRYRVCLAASSDAAFRRVLDDLRWEAQIDALDITWVAGEGEARVECFGDIEAVFAALKAVGQEGAVLAVQRA
jgi:hypothetical protein